MPATDTDPSMGITKCLLRAPQSKTKDTIIIIKKLQKYNTTKKIKDIYGMHYMGLKGNS